MKVFEKDGKINFVDKNNVFVGYDLSQSCCEYADWFISDSMDITIPKEIKHEGEVLDDFVFDVTFFREGDSKEYDGLDEGRMVIFRIFSGNQEKFLHLFNCHNGYYGHGFEFKIDNKIEKEGCL